MHQPDPTTGEHRDDQLTRLVREHARLLYRVAYAVLRNPADAEDAVQDAFLKLHRSRELPPLLNERAYLARIVYRTALDRTSTRRPNHLSDDLTQSQLQDPKPTPETLAATTDEHALLHHLIDQLPEDLRQPLLLSAIDGLNSRETGEILNLPDATVRTRLHRARAELRYHFDQLNQRRGRPEVAATAERITP